MQPTTDLHYGAIVTLACQDHFLTATSDATLTSAPYSHSNLHQQTFILIPLKPNTPLSNIESRLKKVFSQSKSLPSEQQQEPILESCLEGLEELDYFVSAMLEDQAIKQGRGIPFADKFHLQHCKTGKYLGHSVSQAKGRSQMLLVLSDNPTEHTFFSVRNCYEYQRKISAYPRYFQDSYIVSVVGIKQVFIGPAFTMTAASPAKIQFHLYSEFPQARVSSLYSPDLLWLIHTETKGLLSVEKDKLCYNKVSSSHKRPFTGIWQIQGQQLKRGGKIDYRKPFRLRNYQSGRLLAFLPPIPPAKEGQITLETKPSDRGLLCYSPIDRFSDAKLNVDSFFFVKGVMDNTFLGQEGSIITCSAKANVKDVFQCERLSFLSTWEINKVMQVEKAINLYMERIEGQTALNIRNMEGLIEELSFLTYNSESLEGILGNISSTTTEQVRERMRSKGMISLLCNFLVSLSSPHLRAETIHKTILLTMKVLENLIKDDPESKKECSEHLSVLLFFAARECNSETVIFQLLRQNPLLKKALGSHTFHGDDFFLFLLKAFRAKRNKHMLLEVFGEALCEAGKGMSINQIMLSKHLFESGYLQSMCMKVSRQEQEGFLFDGVSLQGLSKQQQHRLAKELILYSKLCFDRNYKAIAHVKQLFDAHTLLTMVSNSTLPRHLRAGFLQILVNAYLDVSPRFSNLQDGRIVVLGIEDQSNDDFFEHSARSELLQKREDKFELREMQQGIRTNIEGEHFIVQKLLVLIVDFYAEEITMDALTEAMIRTLILLCKFKLMNERQKSSTMKYLLQLVLEDRQELERKAKENRFYATSDEKKIIARIQQQETKKKLVQLYRKKINEQPEKFSQGYFYPFSLMLRKRLLVLLQTLAIRLIFQENTAAVIIKSYSLELLNLMIDNDQKDRLKQLVLILIEQPTLSGNEKARHLRDIVDVEEFRREKPVFAILVRQFITSKSFFIKSQCLRLIIKLFSRRKHLLDQLSYLTLIYTRTPSHQSYLTLSHSFLAIKHLFQTSEIWFAEELLQRAGDTRQVRELINLLSETSRLIGKSRSEIDLSPINVKKEAQMIILSMGFHKQTLQFLDQNRLLFEDAAKGHSPQESLQLLREAMRLLVALSQHNLLAQREICQQIDVVERYLPMAEVGQYDLIGNIYRANSLQKELPDKILYSILAQLLGPSAFPHHKLIEALLDLTQSPFEKTDHERLRYIASRLVEKDKLVGFLLVKEGQFELYKAATPYLYHSSAIKLLLKIYHHLPELSMTLKSSLCQLLPTRYLFTLLWEEDCFSQAGEEARGMMVLKTYICQLLVRIHLRSSSIFTNIHLTDYFKHSQQRLCEMYKYAINVSTISKGPIYGYSKGIEDRLDLTFEQYIHRFLTPIFRSISRSNSIPLHELAACIGLVRDEDPPVQNQPINILDRIEMVPIFEEQKDYSSTVMDIIFADQVQTICEEQHIELFESLIQLKQSNFHILHLQALLQEQREHEEKTLFTSKDFFIALEEFTNELLMRLHVTYADDLFQLLEKLLFLYSGVLEKKEVRNTVVELLESNFIEEFIKLSCGVRFRIEVRMHRTIFILALQIFTIMIKTNNSQNIFYSILVHNNRGNFSTEPFFSNLKLILHEYFLHLREAAPEPLFSRILQTLFHRPQQGGDQVITFIKMLNENEERLPFNKFFRSQANSMQSTDFMLLLVGGLRNSIFVEGNFHLSVSRLQKVQIISKCLISFLQGPNQKNQVDLAESALAQLIFEVMKQEYCTNVCRMSQQQAQAKNELIQRSRLHTKSLLQLQEFFQYQYGFSKRHYNLLKLSLCKILVALSEGDNSLVIAKISNFLPLEYLLVNIIWVYQLFKKERQSVYSQELLAEPDQKYILQKMVHEEPVEELVLELGFSIFPFVRKYQRIHHLADTQHSAQEEGQFKVLAVFFQRLLGRSQETIPHYEPEVSEFVNNYQNSSSFFDQYSIRVEIQTSNGVYAADFPRLPLCDHLTEEMKEKVKQSAGLSHAERTNIFIRSMDELSDQLLIQKQVRDMFWGYCLNNIPLYYFMMLLTIIQLIIVASYHSNSNSNDFLLGFRTNYILPLQNHNAAYGTLIVQVLLLVCVVLKFVNIIFYRLITQYLRGQNELTRTTRQHLLQGLSTSQAQAFCIYAKNILDPSLLYELAFIGVSILTALNPFLGVFLFMDLFSKRYFIINMVFQALVRPWRLLLVIILIWIILNYFYAFIYFRYYYDSETEGNVCLRLLTCFYFVFDQTYRADTGFLSVLLDANTPYFNPQYSPSFKIVMDYSYIVLGIQLISVLIGGTIIDTFSEMRAKDGMRKKEMVQRCYICDIDRVVLAIEQEGYMVHTNRNHNMWNYIFFLTYLKQKRIQEMTTLQLYFYKCIQERGVKCLPFQNSVFVCQKSKKTPRKQTLHQEVGKIRQQFELIVEKL